MSAGTEIEGSAIIRIAIGPTTERR
jgi:hypothetical protein